MYIYIYIYIYLYISAPAHVAAAAQSNAPPRRLRQDLRRLRKDRGEALV